MDEHVPELPQFATTSLMMAAPGSLRKKEIIPDVPPARNTGGFLSSSFNKSRQQLQQRPSGGLGSSLSSSLQSHDNNAGNV